MKNNFRFHGKFLVKYELNGIENAEKENTIINDYFRLNTEQLNSRITTIILNFIRANQIQE